MTAALLRFILFVVAGALTIAAFAAVGYYTTPKNDWTPHSRYVEWALSWGSLGAAIVACVGVALVLIWLVRARRLSRGWSITVFTLVATGSIILPPTLMLALRDYFGPYLFYGDSGFFLPIMSGIMLLASAIMITAFIVYVLHRVPGHSNKVA